MKGITEIEIELKDEYKQCYMKYLENHKPDNTIKNSLIECQLKRIPLPHYNEWIKTRQKDIPLNFKKQVNNMKRSKTIHEIIRESTDYVIKHSKPSHKTAQKQKLEILHNFLKEIPEEEITNTLNLSKHLYTNYHDKLKGTKYKKSIQFIKTWINKYHALLEEHGCMEYHKQYGGTKHKKR